jgi:hypothetical protein
LSDIAREVSPGGERLTRPTSPGSHSRNTL